MRDDFSEEVKRKLAGRAGHVCSNPDCRQPTSGPSEAAKAVTNVGVAAHITAASAGGPRYDSSLTQEQRSDLDNGVWLCQNCAKAVDDDPITYNEKVLRNWKSSAEEAARKAIEEGPRTEHPPATSGLRPNIRLIDAPNEAGYHHLHVKNFGSVAALDIVLVALNADPSILRYVPVRKPILLQSLDAGEQRYAFGTMFSTGSSLIEDPMFTVCIEYDDAVDNHYRTIFEGLGHRSESIRERTIPLGKAGGTYEALDSLDGTALEETLANATDAEREGYLDDLQRSAKPIAASLDKKSVTNEGRS
jgi:hypothetical protein